MDEPTDRALRLQGISREEYDSMSREGKTVVVSRSRRLVELSNITIAAELFNAIAEGGEQNKAFVAEVLDGRRPDLEEPVRQIIRDYLEADLDTSIRDYYKIKFGSGLPILIQQPRPITEPLEQAAPEPSAPPKPQERATPQSVISYTQEEETQQPLAQTPAPEQAQEYYEPEPAQPPQPQAPAAPVEIPKPRQSDKVMTLSQRRMAIAAIISQSDRRNVETIMRTEADVIELVMTITNENEDKGVNDESICKAAEAMIKSSINGVQFLREALMPTNRADIIQIARTFL